MNAYKPLLETCAKALLGLGLIVLSIWALERDGQFEDEYDSNNHRKKRWEYLYHMADAGTPIDIVVLGNSHAYTGLSPEYLSAATESNAFVLANNGSNVADTYWNLKELLTLHTPELVALETYTINHDDHGNMSQDMLVNQIRAFNTRRNPDIRRASLFSLFPIDDVPIATSDAVRNHHYVWEGFPERPKQTTIDFDKRYLGRFIRFTSGITDSLLTAYEELGPSVEGAERTISNECLSYTTRIAKLCEANGIELVLFTLPMYEKHVANVEVWMQRYADLAHELNVPYLDLQTEGDMASHPEYFENTLKGNQHMTLQGSIRAADELGHYVDSLYPGEFHQRADDEAWKKYHMGNRGMLVYAKPSTADPSVQVISNGSKAPDFDIDQILLNDVPGNPDIQELWVRIHNYKKPLTTSNKDLILRFDFRMKDNPVMDISLRIPRYELVQRDDMAVFRRTINRVEIVKLKAVALAVKE